MQAKKSRPQQNLQGKSPFLLTLGLRKPCLTVQYCQYLLKVSTVCNDYSPLYKKAFLIARPDCWKGTSSQSYGTNYLHCSASACCSTQPPTRGALRKTSKQAKGGGDHGMYKLTYLAPGIIYFASLTISYQSYKTLKFFCITSFKTLLLSTDSFVRNQCSLLSHIPSHATS